jgi:hypothetical protein
LCFFPVSSLKDDTTSVKETMLVLVLVLVQAVELHQAVSGACCAGSFELHQTSSGCFWGPLSSSSSLSLSRLSNFIRLSLGPVVLEPLNFIRLHQAVSGALASSSSLSSPRLSNFIRLSLGPVVLEPLNFIRLHQAVSGAPSSSLSLSSFRLSNFIRLSLGPPVVLEPLNFIRLHQAVSGGPRPRCRPCPRLGCRTSSVVQNSCS